jgi:hypothetical protein
MPNLYICRTHGSKCRHTGSQAHVAVRWATRATRQASRQSSGETSMLRMTAGAGVSFPVRCTPREI